MYPEGEKKISEIKEGDLVLDADGNPKKVLHCGSCHTEEIIHVVTESGREIEVTENHLVKTRTGSLRAAELTPCGYLLTKERKEAVEIPDNICSVEKSPCNKPVYHIELQDGGTLIGNGIVSCDSSPGSNGNAGWPEEVLKTREILRSALRK